MKSKQIIIYILTFLLSANLVAQEQKHKDGKHHEQIMSARIAHITSKVGISSEEAEKFWPLYEEYKDQCSELRKDIRLKIQEIEALTNNRAIKTEEQYKNIIEQYVELLGHQEEIEVTFFEKFYKVIGAEKTAKLIIAEESFRTQLIKMYNKEKHPEPKEEEKSESRKRRR